MTGLPSASLQHLTGRVVCGEGGACLGIDGGAETVAGAPAGECVRVYYGADHPVAVGLKAAFRAARLLQPKGIGRGQYRVRHDRQGGCVVGFVEPRDADNANLAAMGGVDVL